MSKYRTSKVMEYCSFILMMFIIFLFGCCGECNDKPTPRKAPSPTVNNPTASNPSAESSSGATNNTNQAVIVNVMVEDEDNSNEFKSIDERLTALEATDELQNAKLAEIEQDILELEDRVVDIALELESNTVELNKLVTLYQTINLETTSQFNALWNSLRSLELTVIEYKNLSTTRYNELYSLYQSLQLLVINLTTKVNSQANILIGIQATIASIQTSQLTVTQVTNIAQGLVDASNPITFKQPCNLPFQNNELVMIQGSDVFAFLVNCSDRGGISELKPNVVYSNTVGATCKFSFQVVNNKPVFTIF